jgi:hypothetical protein
MDPVLPESELLPNLLELDKSFQGISENGLARPWRPWIIKKIITGHVAPVCFLCPLTFRHKLFKIKH